jgi:hypothetical protein
VTRLAGHALLHEGAAHDYVGLRIVYGDRSTGRAKCECGAMSEVLPSGAARRRWHAEIHKPAVLNQQA